ncbi:hypothetical protein [Kribbella sp. NPDC051620]|uniref:hypothetical protein n=1 Tax=Kribbella sp. NPDC051620 TaxID=3364120 RepID=UPI0037B58AEA
MVVLISGIQPDHHQPLDALDAIAHLRSAGRVFAHTPDAIAAARGHLHRAGIVVSGQYSP